ncbi:AAA family ATPase [Tomitella biformata]|uniref:AAA family ATPase n=1 Tax=Tomitella biformata TaxID=630403 RepID=UPI0004679986|nr:SMC family ATPase [Tomitella biformata]
MRLHKLEITAFGAFAGTEKVDFDELGADGLFLLHGQTGAGKTTVLDAVAYALYGTVPGSRQSGKRLHSDHAARDVRPQVVLEATLGGRDLRLTRSPEFMRPKQRGEGFTLQQASGTLEWLDGSGENLSRLNDIGAEVLRLLGMSAEQFFQVVLLPQGEFARFLKAETKDRAKLLEKLFDTSRFKSVEDWFADRKSVSAAGLARQRQAIDLELAALATAAGGDNFEPTAEQPSALGWAEALVATCAAAVAASEVVLTASRATSNEHAKNLARLQGQARAQQRARDATAQLAAYTASAAERVLMADEAEMAGRAEKVEWANTALTSSTKSCEALVGQVAVLERDLDGDATAAPKLAVARSDRGELNRPSLLHSVREWEAELTLLEQARGLEDVVTRDSRLLADTRDSISTLTAKADRNRTELEALPGEVATIAAKVVAAQAAKSELPGLTMICDEAKKAVRAAQDMVLAQAEQIKCDTAVATATTAYNDARDIALDLRERRLNGMAAELAGQLVAGESCAVCGSVEHPAPAIAADNLVTKEAEDATQKVVVTTYDALEGARAAQGAAQQAVVLHTATSGGLDPASAKQELAKATTRLGEAAELAGTLVASEARATTLQVQRGELEKDLATFGTDTALAEQKYAQLELHVADTQRQLVEIIGEDANVAARSSRIAAARDRVSGLAELRGKVDAAREAVEKDQAVVAEAVAAAAFDSLASALAAVRTTARRSEIATAISAAAEGSASARAVLQEPEVVEVAGLDPVGVAEAEAAAASAAEELEQALTAHDQADNRSRAVLAKFHGLKSEVANLAPIEKRHESLSALAEVMLGDGQNSRRMSLGTYVLAARLEEVAVVASRRLRAMSGGRFEFIHSDGKVKRELRGGLALNILDANTGSIRPTSTLSGGETFMASLSLALGLADVVAEESGGIQLETLFIDEGFGTLDAEALDLVMGVLDELRAGGRSVGIVSHVAEMQHRIPNRLFVKKGETGSTLHMHEG